MTEEEYQRIKEAEKERLQARRKLRTLKKRSAQADTIQSALRRVKRGAKTLLQRSSNLIDRLTHAAAREEARLEVALDATSDDELSTDAQTLEDADREARAEALVQQLKRTVASDTAQHDAPTASASDPEDLDDPEDPDNLEDPDNPKDANDPLPEKTIGRMRRE